MPTYQLITSTKFLKDLKRLKKRSQKDFVLLHDYTVTMKKHIKHHPLMTILVACVFFLTACQEPQPFKLVLLPDTQVYSHSYPEIFRAQTEWIVEHADSVAFVLHQGDITDFNSEEEWQNASAALAVMDGKVPYTFVPGNHDLGPKGSTSERDATLLNTYLPYEKYSNMSHFGGAFAEGSMENTYHTFQAGGLDWLILSLEFGARDGVLKWAGEVIEAHPEHKVIINTHAYMYSDDTRMNIEKDHSWVPQKYGVGKDTGDNAVNDGEMMWQKLVSQHKNILLVFSGHVLHDGAGQLVSTGVHGNTVYQMLGNYQSGVEGSENGGNGFLRMVTIDPGAGTISVKAYSPYVDAYKTAADQQFVFENVRF